MNNAPTGFQQKQQYPSPLHLHQLTPLKQFISFALYRIGKKKTQTHMIYVNHS